MTESIKETVSQLYALRAGMSVISKVSDDKYADERLGEEKLEKIRSSRTPLNCEIWDYEKDSKEYTSSFLEKWKREYKKAKRKRKFLIALWVLAIISIPVGVLLLLFSATDWVPSWIQSWVIPLPAISSIIMMAGITPIGIARSEETTFYKGATDYMKRCEREISCAEEKIKKISGTNIKALKNELSRIDKEEERLEEALEKKVKDYIANGNAIYTALVNEYSKILDIRDWENIDLIIFYLETGRAESMKEALQQVDRQRQMDSIVEAIATASRQICSTIQRGMEYINNTIISSAKLLSSQIEGISTQLTGVNNILTAHSMQNALEEKADASSIQLMEDVHQMRIYADNAEVKRRNS